MKAVALLFRMLEFALMTLVVAGFMLAFIHESSRGYFVCVVVAPLGLVFHGVSAMLMPRSPEEL